MRDFIISTDSNSDLPQKYIDDNNVIIIPHYYDIDGVVYGDELNLEPKEFYDLMRGGKMPTTMASNPQVIRDTFTRCVNDGYDILHLSFSSALSGGCSNVTVGGAEISEEHPECRITVLDTANVSSGQGLVVMKAVEMKKAGASFDEIVSWVEENKLRFVTQFTVDDLFHLHRGGRLSKATAIIGSIVNIKPLLAVNNEGKLVSISTVRGRKRSLNTLMNAFLEAYPNNKDNNKTIYIVHGDAEAEAENMATELREKTGCEVIVNMISPSIGSHSGPGAIGICYFGDSRE